jgi:predicted RNA binding protein YcfA (HicA-like mRNA interferase family)
MTKRERLLKRAKNSPAGIHFNELCQLAEWYGWVFYRQEGSHRQYRRPGFARSVNVQEARNGMAKPQQVRDLVRRIELLDDLDGGGRDDAE